MSTAFTFKIALNAPRVAVNRAEIREMDQTTGPHVRSECVNLANMENTKQPNNTKQQREKEENRLDLLTREKKIQWQVTLEVAETILKHSSCIHLNKQGFILIILKGDNHHSNLMRK